METYVPRPPTESLTGYCNGTDKYGAYNFGITKESFDELSKRYLGINDTYKNLKSFVGKNGKEYYSFKIKDGCPLEPISLRYVEKLKGKKVNFAFDAKFINFKPKGNINDVSGCSFTLRSIDKIKESTDPRLPLGTPVLVRT